MNLDTCGDYSKAYAMAVTATNKSYYAAAAAASVQSRPADLFLAKRGLLYLQSAVTKLLTKLITFVLIWHWNIKLECVGACSFCCFMGSTLALLG